MTTKVKVLISEDDKEFVTKSAAIFNAHGFETITAPKNGFKVLECIRAQKPDIVLMEVFMPHLDAIGVMQAVKSDNIRMPLFMTMSSFDSTAIEKELTSFGAAYFFIKPLDTEIMVERIIQLSKGKQPAGENSAQPAKSRQSKIELEVMVTETIHQVGVPAHIKGYYYLRDSIILAIEQPEIINSVTKQLYPTVAKKNNTTSSRVERAIRHAIEVAWDRGDVDTLNSYFGYTIHNGRGKPTNSEFIAMISDKMRLKRSAA